MTDDLLGGDTLPQTDPDKDYWKELTTEGGKFYDPDPEKAKQKIARGKIEADLLIDLFKRRQDELRADLLKEKEYNSQRANVEELLKQFNKQPASSTEQTANVDNTPPKYELDPAKIASLIDDRMEARDASRKRQENFNTVQAKLQERFGDNFQNVLKEQMAALDLTKEDVNNLAYKSPKAFFKTLGLDEQRQESFQAPVRSTRRPDTFNQKGNQKRTWSYYQELRKTDPQLYYNPKIANQMQEDYKVLGKAFEDGDFQQFGDGI